MNWSKFLPGLLCLLFAFLAGALAGGFTGRPAGEGQMLAGGVIVAFHMLIGGGIGVTTATYFIWRWPSDRLWRLSYGLLIVTVLLGVLTVRTVDRGKAERTVRQRKTVTHHRDTTANVATFIQQKSSPPVSDRARGAGPQVRGFGFVHVPFTGEGVRLSFYADSDLRSRPVDSLIYVRKNNRNVLRYAPSYLSPYYLKEDYDSMILRLLGVGDQRVFVELNAETGQRAWVDKGSVRIAFWPQFLSEVFAVHALDPALNPVRVKALDGAAVKTGVGNDDLLLSGEVIEDWIRVRTMETGGDKTGLSGWLRWRRGDELLVGWDYRL